MSEQCVRLVTTQRGRSVGGFGHYPKLQRDEAPCEVLVVSTTVKCPCHTLSHLTVATFTADPSERKPDPDLIASLHDEALLLQHIVDNLQDLAAADAGTLALHREPVHAQDLVNRTVSAHRTRAESSGVRLCARTDSGIVLDADPVRAEDLPHVFERFWRAEKSRSRRTGGSGLGLSIVRQFVEAHGGTVTVDSEPGKDCVFTIRLPRARHTNHRIP
jgi:two-component system sensor histidine kinase BaeS